MPKIKTVTARYFSVPLREVLTDAMHGDHSHFELVTATVGLDDGAVRDAASARDQQPGRNLFAVVRDYLSGDS